MADIVSFRDQERAEERYAYVIPLHGMLQCYRDEKGVTVSYPLDVIAKVEAVE